MENKQVILIIGASRGIGRATALAFAAPGTHLVLAARDGAALEAVAGEARAAGADASAVPCDVTAEPHVRRLIENAAGITGQIDMLINSAGGAMVAPFEQLALEGVTAGCGGDIVQQMMTNAETKAKVTDAIVADQATAGEMIDKLINTESSRGMVLEKLMGNGEMVQGIMGRIARDQTMVDGVLNMAVQDSTMREHIVTLFKGMQMSRGGK